MDALERYGGATWFRLGDRDLGTHLYRTAAAGRGRPLSTVTGEIAARAWGLELRAVLPVTDDRDARTMVDAWPPAGEEIAFQEYFVRPQHAVPVAGVRFAGAEAARARARACSTAHRRRRQVVVAPSNPIVSIGPVLAVPGMREAVAARRRRRRSRSRPSSAARRSRAPPTGCCRELGHEASVVGVARLYAPVRRHAGDRRGRRRRSPTPSRRRACAAS